MNKLFRSGLLVCIGTLLFSVTPVKAAWALYWYNHIVRSLGHPVVDYILCVEAHSTKSSGTYHYDRSAAIDEAHDRILAKIGKLPLAAGEDEAAAALSNGDRESGYLDFDAGEEDTGKPLWVTYGVYFYHDSDSGTISNKLARASAYTRAESTDALWIQIKKNRGTFRSGFPLSFYTY